MNVSTRERLLDEGMRLFAVQGFRATTVADIQLACGLTGGSGALYKHFASKQDLLKAGMQRFLTGIASAAEQTAESLPTNPRDAFRIIVDVVWATMDDQTATHRIILRDLEQFPDLLEDVWSRLAHTVYTLVSDWLSEQHARGEIDVADPEATAAVLMASLTYHHLLGDLIGRVPGDIASNRFADAWIEHAVRTLHP